MYKIYDFECPNGHVVEKFVPNGTESVGAIVVLKGHVWYLPRLLS